MLGSTLQIQQEIVIFELLPAYLSENDAILFNNDPVSGFIRLKIVHCSMSPKFKDFNGHIFQ